MKTEKKKTIDYIKEKRTVPEALKEKRKYFNNVKKLIKKSLANGPKTILEIAQEIELSPQIVTYNLMTCRKYGEIEAGEVNDMDEYYYYQLKKKKT